MEIRPVVLAGGRGTRMRPRTDVLPKPLLPVDGRPLLWYAIRAALAAAGRPTIALDYKADLIQAFFAEDDVDMIVLRDSTMVQSLLTISEQNPADAYLCMSCDVLMPPQALAEAVARSREQGCCAAGFTELPEEGHKKWHYEVADEILVDLQIKETKTTHERVALVVPHEALHGAVEPLPKPIRAETNPEELRPFNDGWTLLLRALLDAGVEIHATQTQVPLCNVNEAGDLVAASKFAHDYLNL
jgi:NDP-sugar pyrophosphorylase family protein